MCRYRYGASHSSSGDLATVEQLALDGLPEMAGCWLSPADAAAVDADELANRRLLVGALTPSAWPADCCCCCCCEGPWSGGEPDRLRSPMLPRLLADGGPTSAGGCPNALPPATPMAVAATIDFFLPVAPKLKNLTTRRAR